MFTYSKYLIENDNWGLSKKLVWPCTAGHILYQSITKFLIPGQGWGQIRLIKYKYKYKYIFFRSFKYKYKYKYTGKNLIKYKYKYKYSSSNTNTNTNTQWGRDKIDSILQMKY